MNPEKELLIEYSSDEKRYFWLLIGGVWLVLALLMAGQLYFRYNDPTRSFSWWQSLTLELFYCLQWVALAPFTLRLAEKYSSRKTVPKAVGIHLIAGFVLASLTMGIRAILSWIIIRNMETSLTLSGIMHTMTSAYDYGIMSYLLNVLLSYSYQYYHMSRQREVRAARLETELSRAQLQALKNQLHPHFFFNTLNAVAVLIRKQQNTQAIEMIARLSKFLRHTLDKSDTQEISLKEELDALSQYLEIQQIRFNDKLTVRYQIDNDVLDSTVPALILQPIVENAIQHGISNKECSAVIELIGKRSNGKIQLLVTDNGNGIQEPFELLKQKGIGLQNTISRLEKLYGTAFDFSLSNMETGGTIAQLTLPYKRFSSSA